MPDLLTKMVAALCLLLAGCVGTGTWQSADTVEKKLAELVSQVRYSRASSAAINLATSVSNTLDVPICVSSFFAEGQFPDGSSALYAFEYSGSVEPSRNAGRVMLVHPGQVTELAHETRLLAVDAIDILYMGMSPERAAAEDKTFKDKVRKGDFVLLPSIHYFTCTPNAAENFVSSATVVDRSAVEALSEVVTINFDPITVHLSR